MDSLQLLLQKYETGLPRYTSYPTANHFRNGFEEENVKQLILQSNHQGPEHLAFYIHIPFCRRICHYCGCNACISGGDAEIRNYVDDLKLEIRYVKQFISPHRKVAQIHYGGGTPNVLSISMIAEINQELLSGLTWIEQPEIAMECHPAWLDASYADQLTNLGFNRLSIGIQDFNPKVLQVVNRTPPVLPPEELLDHLRHKKDRVSVNLDFIYGLPGQTVTGFRDTIQRAINMRPNRLVTFSYAHVPWLKKHQVILEKAGLPDASAKAEMFLKARELLLDAGYTALGLDHYVLPEDELHIALRNKELNRNFQGYCTKKTTGQVYAFGVSAISQLESGYMQNVKDLDQYRLLIRQQKLPVEKGLVLTREETIIRRTIHSVLCNQNLDISEICFEFGLSRSEFDRITGFHPGKLADFQKDDLIEYCDPYLKVKEKGTLFLRNIAAAFDPALGHEPQLYSKSI